jgi:hypothetical protein
MRGGDIQQSQLFSYGSLEDRIPPDHPLRAIRAMKATPHVAQNDRHRRSAIGARTTRHDGYLLSQRRRKLVQEAFGWMTTIALQRKPRFRGLARVGLMLNIAAAAYNLVRIRNLSVQAGRSPRESKI